MIWRDEKSVQEISRHNGTKRLRGRPYCKLENINCKAIVTVYVWTKLTL